MNQIIHPSPKLGLRPARHDRRTLRLAHYLTDFNFTPPAARNWYQAVKTSWGELLNSTVGDCAIAGPAHLDMLWTANAGGQACTITDSQVLQEYEAESGYQPGKPDTDVGCDLLCVMNRWRQRGLFGRKIRAYVALEAGSQEMLEIAVEIFGGVILGVDLPLSARGARVWDVPPGGPQGKGAPGGWGGHCVAVGRYSKLGAPVITWGQELPMTWRFYETYCSQAFVPLSDDWLTAGKISPSHFDVATLMTDLQKIAA